VARAVISLNPEDLQSRNSEVLKCPSLIDSLWHAPKTMIEDCGSDQSSALFLTSPKQWLHPQITGSQMGRPAVRHCLGVRSSNLRDTLRPKAVLKQAAVGGLPADATVLSVRRCVDIISLISAKPNSPAARRPAAARSGSASRKSATPPRFNVGPCVMQV